MGIVHILNMIVAVGYYLIAAYFLVAVIKAFLKEENVQDSILYAIIMIPFVLRLLRLK